MDGEAPADGRRCDSDSGSVAHSSQADAEVGLCGRHAATGVQEPDAAGAAPGRARTTGLGPRRLRRDFGRGAAASGGLGARRCPAGAEFAGRGSAGRSGRGPRHCLFSHGLGTAFAGIPSAPPNDVGPALRAADLSANSAMPGGDGSGRSGDDLLRVGLQRHMGPKVRRFPQYRRARLPAISAPHGQQAGVIVGRLCAGPAGHDCRAARSEKGRPAGDHRLEHRRDRRGPARDGAQRRGVHVFAPDDEERRADQPRRDPGPRPGDVHSRQRPVRDVSHPGALFRRRREPGQRPDQGVRHDLRRVGDAEGAGVAQGPKPGPLPRHARPGNDRTGRRRGFLRPECQTGERR